ncbi:hypothetical protein NHX12_027043 [Muraenolepis orangiensis]|uniref:Ciliogenesis and planar polarity effector 1 n=1 Tax=Muraenolepis orangiensis TaxID=630683 RepID=A0A9Q0ILI7_9TELE|nr:hypothetical protein NHX12_027043 [Muraenolepis orangiensis]
MELKLEVVLSSSIKRKKPWPRFCWLGQEKEAVFLLDDRRISEVNMVTGRTKKKTPKLQPLLHGVVTMAASKTGEWLAGLLVSGELFLWNRDKDWLKTASAVPEVTQLISTINGNGTPSVSLCVSGDGMRVVLAAVTGQVYLWECADPRDLRGVRDGAVKGRWAHIQPSEETVLPSLKDKEASQHGVFVKNEAVGDVFLSVFVFASGDKLSVTFLQVQWEEGVARGVGCVDYSVKWATKTYPMPGLTPPCRPVKSRGALVPALAPDGRLLAVALNQKDPRATQVLFVSTQNFVSVVRGLGGCGSKNLTIPSKYTRSYWVGGVSWSPTGLLLACVLKRGSLLMLARLGELLSLSSTGCNVDFGPAHFLPLPPESWRGGAEASLSSSGVSYRDVLRQRFSVTWHPRLCYLLVSDGYMVTALRLREKVTPALLMTALLQEAGRDTETTVQRLEKSQLNVRAWLDSVCGLDSQEEEDRVDPRVSSGPDTLGSQTASPQSALPRFLQDQGTMGDTRELLHKAQAFFEDDSDVDVLASRSQAPDGGVLEFASMFDTLHARWDTLSPAGPGGPADPGEDDLRMTRDFFSSTGDSEKNKKMSRSSRVLRRVKGHLLSAWALGLSLGASAEERRHLLLTHAVRGVLRLAALLHYTAGTAGKRNISGGSDPSQLFDAFLVFLPWDAFRPAGQSCLGPVVELTQKLVRLLLSPLPGSSLPRGRCGSPLSSQSIASALRLVQQAADSLDHTYTLQQRHVWASSQDEPAHLWTSDVYHVPLLQALDQGRCGLSGQLSLPVPQRPSSRLLVVWRWIYSLTLRYTEALSDYQACEGGAEELERTSVVLSQIQEALQGAGAKLGDGPALLGCPGERHFLLGSYDESAEAWRSEMWTVRNGSGGRSVYQETRLCLAVLYGLLFQYRLREAQALGDHMARRVLDTAAHRQQGATPAEGEETQERESWLPTDLHLDAALAAVQTLGRFMASYFTNRPLCVPPPHSVEVLPPLHLSHAPSVGRLVPLCQERVARAVREEHLSEVWTVDYAQDLLLLGGLLPEAAWLAHRLGDWKTAVCLSLAYTSYRDQRFPGSPLEAEDWEALCTALQDMLTAAAMAGVDVASAPLSGLMASAKTLASRLPALVPPGVYLPAPPLYCPQPAPDAQDPVGTWGPVGSWGSLAEVSFRQRVSTELRMVLLLLRSARCCRPAARWYVSRLRRARHVLHKIQKKYRHPRAAPEEAGLPEGLAALATGGGFFRKDTWDPVTVQTINCFRDLCGLCWLLHVRDQLSVSCRRYQAARNAQRDAQESDDPEMRASCVEAVRWACRLLPFSRFLNTEEILQDLLLSLVSELPPLSMVADTLARAFPTEDDSVRVPLREKYHSLLERLKNCTVIGDTGEESGEVMMVTLQDKRRQRRKDLQRLHRHLAPPQLFLLSNSTLIDQGQPMVYSDGENTSEALSPVPPSRTTTSKRMDRDKAKSGSSKTHKVPRAERDGGPKGPEGPQRDPDGPALPVVGTWEFELEDEEYPRFLELFLSYVLEKDGSEAVGGQDGCELPLLRGFCPLLRQRELHSLAFDVLSTLRRRQKDGRHGGMKRWPSGSGPDVPIFRAGNCFTPAAAPDLARSEDPPPSSSAVWSEAPEKSVFRRTTSGTQLSVDPLPAPTPGRQQGLFGLQQQQKSMPAPERNTTGGSIRSAPSPRQSAVPWENSLESFIFGAPASAEAPADLQHGLDSELEARFPELGRLLEWIVRWANRRTPLGTHGTMKTRKNSGPVSGGTSDEGVVVIRVKASTPAVLTALGLLEHRCSSAPRRGNPRTKPTQTHVGEPHIGEVPALQPQAGWRQEEEGSVDTGYPGSSYTPVTTETPITLPDHQRHPAEPSSGSEEQPERGASPDSPDLQPALEPVTGDSEMGTMTSQYRSLCDHEEVAPEEEAPGSASEDSSLLSVLFVDNDNVLKLEDLRCSERVGEASSAASHGTSGTGDTVGPEAPSDAHPPAAPPVKGAPQEGPEPPRLSGPAAPLTHSTLDLPAHLQPSPESSRTGPVGQLVNDELFRLVQLQQINFMSLMHMVGSTFASLPFMQQAALQAQSLGTPLPPHPYGPQTGPVPPSRFPPVHADGHAPLQTQAGVPVRPEPSTVGVLPNLASGYQPSAASYPDHSKMDFQGFSLPSASRNLPGNVDSAESMRPLSVRAELPRSSSGESLGGLIPTSQGVLTPHMYSATGSMRRKTRASGPYSRNPQRAEVPSLPTLGAGLRLLSCHSPPPPPPPGPTSFPQVSLAPAHRPPVTTLIPAPGRPATPATIQLLHVDPEPRTMFPPSAPVPDVDYVDLLQHLRRLDPPGRTAAGQPDLRLIAVNPPSPDNQNQNQSGATILGASPSPRKTRSRNDKTKTKVTFRPDESIIPVREPNDRGVYDESADLDQPFGDLVGPLEAPLAGQRLLDKAFSTSAQLHAFASTHKSAPESRHVCTNTDPVGPPKLVDKAVSAVASIPALVVPPEALKVQEPPRETPVRDPQLTHRRRPQQVNQQDVPPPEATPSSALLHLIAASVVSHAAASAADTRTSDPPAGEGPETVPPSDPVTDSLLQSGWPRLSDPRRTPEPRSPPSWPPGALSGPPGVAAARFSSCLSEMDGQLAALQSIADHMETEFVNSRMETAGLPVASVSDRPESCSVQPSFPDKSVDSSLGLSGLSDVTDILGELVREGALSPGDLDESRLNSRKAEDRESRKEVRVWMRRKQRERLASYKRQRDEMRQQERRPFAASAEALTSTFTYQAADKKIKEDKDKAVLMEQYHQRTREACALIGHLSATQTGSAPSAPSGPPPATHIPASSRTSSKVQSRPPQPLLDTSELSKKQRWRSPLENQQRFGLHRPVSALPKDRLSQVTRRGMISEARARATPHNTANRGRAPRGPANQGRAPHREGPVESVMSRSLSGAASAGRREEVKGERGEEEEEEREQEEVEASRLWNPPLDISRLPDTKQPKTGVAGLSEDEEDEEEEEEEGPAGMSWLDQLSDSDTSILSGIDWAAIERLVAAEDI